MMDYAKKVARLEAELVAISEEGAKKVKEIAAVRSAWGEAEGPCKIGDVLVIRSIAWRSGARVVKRFRVDRIEADQRRFKLHGTYLKSDGTPYKNPTWYTVWRDDTVELDTTPTPTEAT